MFIDSHCHLNLLHNESKEKFSFDNIINNAANSKVTRMLSVATHPNEHPVLLDIANNFAMVDISAGLHPEHANRLEFDLLEELAPLARDKKVVAIGETGLDYYRVDNLNDFELLQYKKSQQEAFIQQIDLAKQVNKPLIVHTRAAQADTINILVNEQAYDCGGVMHCFTENWTTAKKALDQGFYISFSGIITFNSKVDDILEVVRKSPMDRILIETDSPYLAPVPFRGKTNQPSYVQYVAKRIGELKNLTIEQVAQITTNNYQQLFLPNHAI
jgi:TatD DNase family protein